MHDAREAARRRGEGGGSVAMTFADLKQLWLFDIEVLYCVHYVVCMYV